MATAERHRLDVAVDGLDVSAFTVPTDEPESDGTLEWDSTTIVVVEARAGGETGLGYTYAPAAAGKLVEEKLASEVEGADAMTPAETWEDLGRALRNAGLAARGRAPAHARGRSALRQRRVLLVLARAAARATRWLGGRRAPGREDE